MVEITGCTEQLTAVSFCSLAVVAGTDKCKDHTCCSWCGLAFAELCDHKAYDRNNEPVKGTYCSVKCAVATQNDLDGY